jgi:hypothetical protein
MDLDLIGLALDSIPPGRYAVFQKVDRKNKQIFLYGIGEPDGEEIPDVESIPCRGEQAGGRAVPRLKLEDGSVIYGAECNLMPMALFTEFVQKNDLTVVPAKIEEARAAGFAKLKKDALVYSLYEANLAVERAMKERNDKAALVKQRDAAGVPPEAKVDPRLILAGSDTRQ